MNHVLYVDNTGYIQLKGYKNGLTGEYIDDALVTAEFRTKNGSTISGIPDSMPLNYEVDSNGNYSSAVSENASLSSGDLVTVKVTATSSGIQSVFNCKTVIRERAC